MLHYCLLIRDDKQNTKGHLTDNFLIGLIKKFKCTDVIIQSSFPMNNSNILKEFANTENFLVWRPLFIRKIEIKS